VFGFVCCDPDYVHEDPLQHLLTTCCVPDILECIGVTKIIKMRFLTLGSSSSKGGRSLGIREVCAVARAHGCRGAGKEAAVRFMGLQRVG
jgi:hypothetical protein